MLADWVVSWSSPEKAVLNLVGTTLWIAAIVDIVRTPRDRWYNPRGQVLQLLVVICVGVYYRGVYLPIGPLIWFARRRRGWLGLSPAT